MSTDGETSPAPWQQLLRSRREELGLSRERLASEICQTTGDEEIGWANIRRLEVEARRLPEPRLFVPLMTALDLDPDGWLRSMGILPDGYRIERER